MDPTHLLGIVVKVDVRGCLESLELQGNKAGKDHTVMSIVTDGGVSSHPRLVSSQDKGLHRKDVRLGGATDEQRSLCRR
jgi:hypothetical protein